MLLGEATATVSGGRGGGGARLYTENGCLALVGQVGCGRCARWMLIGRLSPGETDATDCRATRERELGEEGGGGDATRESAGATAGKAAAAIGTTSTLSLSLSLSLLTPLHARFPRSNAMSSGRRRSDNLIRRRPQARLFRAGSAHVGAAAAAAASSLCTSSPLKMRASISGRPPAHRCSSPSWLPGFVLS